MSILRKRIFNKITKKEEIWIEATEKEINLIVFMREEMPFGKCFLITHEGQPERIENPQQIRFFRGDIIKENDNGLSTVDKPA